MHCVGQNKEWKKNCIDKWDQECLQFYQKTKTIKKQEILTQASSKDSMTNKQFIHHITQNDTLQGLSLMYQVSESAIKQRNNLQSNEIYFLASLIIPNQNQNNRNLGSKNKIKSQQKLQFFDQSEEKQLKIQQFMNIINLDADQRHLAECTLRENSWNIQNAVNKYYSDLAWQKKYADILCVFENMKKKNKNPFLNLQRSQTC